MTDYDLELEHEDDGEMHATRIVDADDGTVFLEQRVRTDPPLDLEFMAAAVEQLGWDVDDLEEQFQMGAKDVKRELGEDVGNPFRVDDDRDLE